MTDEYPEPDTALDSGRGIWAPISVSTSQLQPELEDSELGAVLEALLLVVDTPVPVDALAAAVGQPAYRVAAKLRLVADDLTAK